MLTPNENLPTEVTLTLLGLVVCFIGFLIGRNTSSKTEEKSEEIVEKNNRHISLTKKCQHTNTTRKQVLDVDGSVWRNVCDDCGHTFSASHTKQKDPSDYMIE